MDEKAKVAWLQEHLRYEVLMLRFTLDKIRTIPASLDYNAFYESFSIHARNLYHFLTNEGGNMRALDYVPGFKSTKTDATKGANLKIHAQVLHLGGSRPFDSLSKLSSEDCEQMAHWIEAEFEQFIAALKSPFIEAWQSGRPNSLTTHIEVSGIPSATGNFTATTSTSGSTGYSIFLPIEER